MDRKVTSKRLWLGWVWLRFDIQQRLKITQFRIQFLSTSVINVIFNGANFKIRSYSILESIVKCEPKIFRVDPKTFRPIPNQKRMFIGTDKTRRRNKPGYNHKIDRNRRWQKCFLTTTNVTTCDSSKLNLFQSWIQNWKQTCPFR